MTSQLRVVFIASEATPFVKTGGLADVAGSLPNALQRLQVDIRVVLPGYRNVLEQWPDRERVLPNLYTWLGSQQLTFHVHRLLIEHSVPVYVVEREDMFDRSNLYGNEDGDYYDNAERFIFFCRAVIALMHTWDFKPHLVHCNDWHTGLIPLYIQNEPGMRHFKTLFTLHNIGYSGLFSYDKFALTGLDLSHYQSGGLEFFGLWSMLKAGLVYSRAVSTVSPTYALEIQTPEYGRGLDGVLRSRQASVYGLLNGVDYRLWSPDSDPFIAAQYAPEDLSGKLVCKADLIRSCQLDESLMERPLICIISRLDIQKGIDLILPIIKEIIKSLNAGLVIIGTGDGALTQSLQSAGELYSGQFKFFQRFDDGLARRMLAGADMLLVPSRYEPCGLTQLYAMKYGTIPVVRATGGLNDTVSEVNDKTGEGTGFTFKNVDSSDCLSAIQRAVSVYRLPVIWRRIQFNAMSMDFSWEKAAQNYLSLYQELMIDSTS